MSKFEKIESINIPIKFNTLPAILEGKTLADLRCRNVKNLQSKNSQKAKALFNASEQIYPQCMITHDVDLVDLQLCKDKPLTIVICNYDWSEEPVIWVVDTWSAVAKMEVYGDIEISQLPFNVVDITNEYQPVLYTTSGISTASYEMFCSRVVTAYARKRQSNRRDIVDAGYTIEDFFEDNIDSFSE